MKRWWCMNCDVEVKLGKHGQCEYCGSEAVHQLPMNSGVNPVATELRGPADSAPAVASVNLRS